MEKHKKLALEDLLAKKMQREQDKVEFKACYLESLGGEITLKKIPLMRALSMMDGIDTDSLTGSISSQVSLVYACCPVLHDKALQEAYGVVEPADVVLAVLDDNMADLHTLSDAVLGFYGLDGDISDTLKN